MFLQFQAPLSMEFSRQEYWSGLPLPTPGELPNLGNEPAYLASPILAGGFFTAEPLEKSNSTSDILTAKSDYCNATWSTIPWQWHGEDVLLSWSLLRETGAESSRAPSEDPHRMHFQIVPFLKLGYWGMYLPISILRCRRTTLKALTSLELLCSGCRSTVRRMSLQRKP